MTLILRYIYTVIRSLFGPPADPLGVGVVPLRVWPFDLDPNLHLNNGRFLSLMDLGRMDLVIRCGLGRMLWKHGWRPLVASAVVRFRGSILPFQKFELQTRIASWDEKWFIMEQKFMVKGKLVAVGAIKGLFRGPDGNVPTAEVLEVGGVGGAEPPELPAWLEAWRQSEQVRD